jgi:broad specificity phosphatase PhoE
MTMTVTRWWWIRHAPVPNPEGCCYGQSDKDCDVSDAESFQGLSTMLPEESVLVTSDLLRTKKTAAAIAEAGLTFPEQIEEVSWREQSFGARQGMKYQDIWDSRGGRHPYWLAPAYERPPEGESFADLLARFAPTLHRLNREHAGRDIVSVGHGGTIRAALTIALGLQPETALSFAIENLSLTRIDHIANAEGPAYWRVVAVNQRPKLNDISVLRDAWVKAESKA